MKLGKLPAVHDARTLRLAKYRLVAYPTPPTRWNSALPSLPMAGSGECWEMTTMGIACWRRCCT